MDYIVNEEGVKLAYMLSINDSSSPYIVILVHGTFGNKNNLFFPKFAESLKYNVLRFDLQGNGDSEGKFTIGGYKSEVEDIKTVVDWSRSQGYKVVALIGHSKGGMEVLIYSSKYHDVPLIVPISSRVNTSELPPFLLAIASKVEAEGSATLNSYGTEYLIDKQGLEERQQINMPEILQGIKDLVFIIHGDNDATTNVQNAETMEKILGQRVFGKCIIKNAGHLFQEHFDDLCIAINDFFRRAVPLLELRRLI
jgi:uncharacterized protein